jgi:hypothetical protein
MPEAGVGESVPPLAVARQREQTDGERGREPPRKVVVRMDSIVRAVVVLALRTAGDAGAV